MDLIGAIHAPGVYEAGSWRILINGNTNAYSETSLTISGYANVQTKAEKEY